MKIAVIGTGYVGLVTGACFADSGNDVICVDNNIEKLGKLNKGEIPFYEPGLSELVIRNKREERLSFTDDLDSAVKASEIVMIAVGTPPGPDGAADLSAVFAVADGIAYAMNGYKIIVTKSTVPVGTSDKVAQRLRSNTKHEFDVVNNPEFLKEGAALDDFKKPDRVVIGVSSERAERAMEELYAPFLRTGAPLIAMDVRSSEMTKYVSNSMLATRISFMNEMANLCELIGADIQKVRTAVGADKRIGPGFLFPGLGFGGSCFPKDLEALYHTAKEVGYDAKIIESVLAVNKKQPYVMVPRILRHFGGSIEGKTIAIWGLAFKPQTDDMREAPSVKIIGKLLELGARVKAYDPEAMPNASQIFHDTIELVFRNYDALIDADCLLIVTEWNAFRNPDFGRMAKLMRSPVIFDGRSILQPEVVRQHGFKYYSIGQPDGK